MALAVGGRTVLSRSTLNILAGGATATTAHCVNFIPPILIAMQLHWVTLEFIAIHSSPALTIESFIADPQSSNRSITSHLYNKPAITLHQLERLRNSRKESCQPKIKMLVHPACSYIVTVCHELKPFVCHFVNTGLRFFYSGIFPLEPLHYSLSGFLYFPLSLDVLNRVRTQHPISAQEAPGGIWTALIIVIFQSSLDSLLPSTIHTRRR